jgi:hypothetical protein
MTMLTRFVSLGIAFSFISLKGATSWTYSLCTSRTKAKICRLAATKSQVDSTEHTSSRRSTLKQFLGTASLLLWTEVGEANARVGTLPEFSDTNVVLQGVSVRMADRSQRDSMIGFLQDGFDFQILRQRINGPTEETWLGFGPEQFSVPSDFTFPVSSFAKYGGHASIRIVYDGQAPSLLYRTGEPPPGDNVAYLQVAVPGYRISQMVKNGGLVQDAYGFVNVVSPSGLPLRGIVGIVPDPIMFIAIQCADVSKSRSFFEQLGFSEQPYPYARPSKGAGPFEPLQPAKSLYLAPSPNCMGVLLLPSKNKTIRPNPVLGGLNIVYTPSSVPTSGTEGLQLVDPSGSPITFQSFEKFAKEEKETR